MTSRKKFFGSEIGYRIIRVINAATRVGRASATRQSDSLGYYPPIPRRCVHIDVDVRSRIQSTEENHRRRNRYPR